MSRMARRGYILTSGSTHWNTTEEDVSLVRQAFGGVIDTDPCSNPTSIVRARVEYTREDNGLGHPWYGRVYVNPPYGAAIYWWLLKGLLEVYRGNAQEAVYLVPARIDTRWWHVFAMQATRICVVRGRRRFVGAEASAPFPVAFIHLGSSAGSRDFFRAFRHQGSFWRPTLEQRLAAYAAMPTLLGMSPNLSKADENTPVPNTLNALTLTLLRSVYESVKYMTVEEVLALMQSLENDQGGIGHPQFGPLAALIADQGTAMAAREVETEAAAEARKAPVKPKTTKAKKAPAKPKTTKAKKGKAKAAASQTPATQELDEKVLMHLQKLSAGDTEVGIKEVMERLPDYSDQQIRRSLKRLVKAEVAVKSGSTKNTTYQAA